MADDRLDHAVDTVARAIVHTDMTNQVENNRQRGPSADTILGEDFARVLARVQKLANDLAPDPTEHEAAMDYLARVGDGRQN